MTEPMKTVDYFLKYNDVAISVLDRTYFAPHDPLSQVERIKKAMQGYAAQQVAQERERIKHGIYLLYKNNDKPPVLGAIHELIDSL